MTLMREIESKPIPLKSKGLTGDLKRLKSPTDSFLLENKGLKRAVLYSTASRLGIRLITRDEGDGLRVWRNFDVEQEEFISPIQKSIPVTVHATMGGHIPPLAVDDIDVTDFDEEEPDEFADWSDEKEEYDGQTGETTVYRQRLVKPFNRQIIRVEH